MNKFLDEIVGNEKVKSILNRIIESKNIPHAFLFKGIDGAGKEHAAIQLAKALNINSENDESYHKLSLIEKLSEPYIKYILPLPRGRNETDQNDPYEKLTSYEMELINEEFLIKSKNPFYKIQIPRANIIKISSIRDIKKFLSMNYDDLNFRVIIISEAQLMNEEAQNALLKNLEEPPDGVVFILCTAYPEKLRETIRSRCWNLNFQPLEIENVVDILINKFVVEKKLAEEVSVFSGGSVTEAIKLIENNFEDLREKTIKILRYSFGRRYQSAFMEFEDALTDSDQVKIKLLIRMLLIWLNDFQKFRSDKGGYIYFKSHLETLKKFNNKFPDVDIREVSNNLDKISSFLRNNINLNLVASSIVFELSSLVSN
jgi:DNA polymerase-3 subunit delta'